MYRKLLIIIELLSVFTQAAYGDNRLEEISDVLHIRLQNIRCNINRVVRLTHL